MREINLKEEILDGYIVSEKTKRIWQKELDLFTELMRVCKKHNIEICGYAGTLLGAIRHKGFIPWDDDMDFCMTRDNYNKLLKVAEREFRKPYFLQTALSDRRFFCGFARLRNSDTTGISKYYDSPEYNNGIFIDIFVLDGYSYDENEIKKQKKQIQIISKLLNAYYKKQSGSILKDVLALVLQNTLFKFISYEFLVEKYNNILSQYTEKTDRLTMLTHGDYFIDRYWCYKSELQDIMLVPFENVFLPVPSNYSEVLKRTYGEYMKFPPMEKRGTWHEKDGLILDPDISYLDYFRQKK